MAFASGPVSYQRFFVTGSIPADVTDEVVKSFQDHAFGRLAPTPDDVQIGWVGPRHLFETEIVAEHIAWGRFVHLAVRVDRLAAPPNVVRSYVRMEEEAALKASGREYLSRTERRRAREAAALRAEEEARSGGFRRMNSYPVLIDLEGATVYVGGLGAKLGEHVMKLFSDTFGRALEPADAEHAATRLMLASRNARALEHLRPSHLVDPPEGYAEPTTDFAALDLNFLGRELLTWLWFRTDTEEGPLRLRDGGEITVMLDRTLRLKCDYGLSGTDVITADGPTSLPDARAALRTGKQPTKAGLILGGPLGEFRLTLDALRMAVSGLILPEPDEEQDARGRVEQRFESVADAADLLDALFELFLVQRTSKEWNRVVRAMSEWAGGRESVPALRIG